jgi:hypothetical protein
LSFVFILPSLYLFNCCLQMTSVTSYWAEVLNEFRGSHGSWDSYCGFLGNGVVQSGPYVQTFRGNFLPPSSKESETNLEIGENWTRATNGKRRTECTKFSASRRSVKGQVRTLGQEDGKINCHYARRWRKGNKHSFVACRRREFLKIFQLQFCTHVLSIPFILHVLPFLFRLGTSLWNIRCRLT